MIIFTPNTVIKSADINLNFTELKTKTDYLSTPDSGWVEVGSGGTAPPFLNSWVNYTAGTYSTCGFRKDAFGYVHLKGLIKSGVVGDSTPVYALPVGYRPILSMHMVIVSSSAFGNIRISPADGYVRIQVGNNGWVSLDGITFKAEV